MLKFRKPVRANISPRPLVKRLLLILPFAVFCVLCGFVLIYAMSQLKTVTINDDGHVTEFRTYDKDVQKLLSKYNIVFDENDLLNTTYFDNGDIGINITRRVSVGVEFDGQLVLAATNLDTVEELLADVNVTLGEVDALNCQLTDALYEGMDIEVTRRVSVGLTYDGQTTPVVLDSGNTVEELLLFAGVSMGNRDELNCSIDDTIVHGMEVKITRVNSETFTKYVDIPFETTVHKVAMVNLSAGMKNSAGKNGVREQVYERVYADGQVVQERLISEKVVKEPVKAVRYEQDHSMLLAATAEGAPSTYLRAFNVNASAYTSNGGRTATGDVARVGYVAVDPKVIKLNSKLYIVSPDGKYSYGYAVAKDTGGAIKGNKIDIFLPSEKECYAFGRRTMTVYVIEEP